MNSAVYEMEILNINLRCSNYDPTKLDHWKSHVVLVNWHASKLSVVDLPRGQQVAHAKRHVSVCDARCL